MLSLMKKQIAVVLTLGALLSAGNAKAVWTPNAAQTSVIAGAAAAYLYQRHIDVTLKEKSTLTKALDAGTQLTHNVVHSSKTKTALVAVAAGATVYHHQAIIAAVVHFLEALKGPAPRQN